MYYRIDSFTLHGLEAVPVSVEADISDGLPIMELVGYLGSEVKEARERVRTAIKNSGFDLPVKRITVNISPADIRKQGTAFDFPIALSILACMDSIPESSLKDISVMGELCLNGDIQGVTGVLPRVLKAKELGMKACIIPLQNVNEAAIVDGIDVIGVENLSMAVDHLNGKHIISPARVDLYDLINKKQKEVLPDFSQLKGQWVMKRALEIAASGMHNVLLIGPPGAGKTMAARRLPGIMPPLTKDEIMELTKIYSIAGQLPPEGLITVRPFVNPHHTSTPQALVGGGSTPRPGAVSLAHKSVLFLDELPEFSKTALEVLRQPIEDGQVNIARAMASYTFPARFLLIAAMNPCRCGYYPDKNRCRCSEADVRSYMGRISGPLLDRIDLCISADEMKFDDMFTDSPEESSESIRARVIRARGLMQKRFLNENITCNGEMNSSQVMKYCILGEKEKALLKDAFKKLGLSARSYHRILKVARTIADLKEDPELKEEYLFEALSYKLPGPDYFSGF